MQVVAIILGLVGLLALPGLWRGVRATTLVAPWIWAWASGLAILGVTIQGASEPLLNYAAACTTMLPAAAIYGAKRPQDRGWQWIVAALLVMLLWPAGESWLLGQSFDLTAQPLRSWFLLVLFVVQCGNWIITRNAGPVLMLTAAQAFLLWPQLPWVAHDVEANTWYGGSMLLAMVPWWLRFNMRNAAVTVQPPALATSFPSPNELGIWHNFRAAYGVVWALRVTERINEVAKLRHWPWRWCWAGPVTLEAESSAADTKLSPDGVGSQEVIYWQQLWQNIFRRFLATENISVTDSSEATSTVDSVSAS